MKNRMLKIGNTIKNTTHYRLRLFVITLFGILLFKSNLPLSAQQQSSGYHGDYFDIVEQQDAYYDSVIQVRGADSMEDTGYKNYVRWKSFVGMRVDENGSTQSYMDVINGYVGSPQTGSALDWSYKGPLGLTKNINASFGKGWIYCTQVNKDNHNIIYAGAHNSGLWKTVDGGKRWACLTDAYPEIFGVKSIAIPDDDTSTIYILTVHNLFAFFNGLYKSEDSGQTWERVYMPYSMDVSGYFYPSTDMRRFPKKIIIHPDGNDTLFVVTNHYILKTTDGGDNWDILELLTEYPGQEFEDLIFSSSNPDTMYVSGSKVLRSIDMGDTWIEDITSELTNAPSGVKVTTMFAHQKYKGFVWFLLTTKNATTSRIVKYDPKQNEYYDEGLGSTSANYLRNQICVSLVDTSLIYYGTVACMVFNKNNNAFQKYNIWALPWESETEAIEKNEFVHVDIRGLEIFSSEVADTLFIANDGGIRKAWWIGDTSLYGGNYKFFEIEDLSIKGDNNTDDLDATEVFAVSSNERNEKLAFNCQDLAGFLNYKDNWYGFAKGDGGNILIDEYKPDYIYYVDYQGNMYRYNGEFYESNETQLYTAGKSAFYYFPPLEKHPEKKERLYFGHKKLYFFDDVYTTTNADTTVVTSLDNTLYNSQCDTNKNDIRTRITDIEISHNDADLMFVSTEQNYQWWSFDSECNTGSLIDPDYYEKALFKSTDGGNNWTDLSPGLLGLDKGYITDIELNPHDDDELWLTFGYSTSNPDNSLATRKVYHSINGGQSFLVYDQGLPDSLPVWELVYDPITNDLFIATDVGVFKRNVSGASWENINLPYEDTPLKLVYDLDINNKSRTLYAATFGKGLWEAPLGDCPEYTSTPLRIKSDTSWTAPKQIVSDVVVDSGVVLTIKDIVFFNHKARLIVEPGAKLVIDGGVLTNSCDSTYWQGVEVRGQSAEYQSPDRQGWLVMRNHGTIENAITAVLAGSSIPGTGGPEGPGGGIIHAYNAEFINNITAVEFEAYNQRSLSSFDSCWFITNTSWPHFEYPLSFISMDSYKGLEIKGCEFNNKAASDFSVTKRGYGIRSLNSSFTVDQICTSGEPCTTYKNCNFDSLYYGIYAMGSFSETSLLVKNSNFESYRGIYLSAIDNAEVVLNDFIVGSPATGTDEPYGLYLDECTGYHIEANYFNGFQKDNIGLYVNNSGTGDNIIYNNSFNKLNAATVFQDINRRNKEGGLQVKCNDYLQNISDISVVTADSIITSDYGIAHYQGYITDPPTSDPTLPAGNTFSASNNYHYDIYNELNGIVYIHHKVLGAGKKVRPIDNYGNVSPIQNTIAEYGKEQACPSNLNGGGEEQKSGMFVAATSADSIQTAIESMEDGGDTDALDFDVVMSMPGEGLETRDLLLDESPNLSDTVMITAIEKEDVLPNAMIRDVLVENPQAAKSEQVQAALDERSNPMSAYMRQEIDTGRDSLSEKEISEAALTFFRQQENSLFNQLQQYYTADTTISFAADSLKQLYVDNGDLGKQYCLAMIYFKMGDTTSCDSVIDNLQYTFDLSTEQEAERQDYETYLNLMQLHGSKPDSTASAQLMQLLQSENGRPATYARNMLLWLGQTTYNEPLLLPDTSLKMAVVKTDDFLGGSDNETESWLSIKPNPAANYFIAEWNFPYHTKSATLVFTDMNGLLVGKTILYSRENEKVINTEAWHPGTYLISLLVDGQLLETRKLSLIK